MKPLHWSQLRWMRLSPAHYRYYRDNPTPQTPAMRLGWLAHRVVFGLNSYVVYGAHRSGKAWEEFEAEHAGEEIVTGSELAVAQSIAAAVEASPEAVKCLRDGRAEFGLEWFFSGRYCAGRPDVLGSGLTELKITDSNPAKLPWHARRQGWHGQLAWYAAGNVACGGLEPDRISIVAVEPRPPHVVTVFDLSPRCLDEGTRLWRSLFERLRVCEESDCWPGYCEGVSIFDVPDDESVMLQIDGEEVECG